MEVHLGKVHGDKFDCGLCDYNAKDLENLEMHLSTCETYKCIICDLDFTNLSEIKKHFSQKHEPHVKENRDNIDAFDGNHYSFKELFPEL